MDLMEDGVVGILPILRERPSPASGISYDEAMARPLPSYEDYVRMQREEAREDALWVTGEERIRPPAKALAVSTENGTGLPGIPSHSLRVGGGAVARAAFLLAALLGRRKQQCVGASQGGSRALAFTRREKRVIGFGRLLLRVRSRGLGTPRDTHAHRAKQKARR
jgi:hypothetical protein